MAASVPSPWVPKVADLALLFRLRLQERARRARAHRIRDSLPSLRSFADEPLEPSVLEREAPWDGLPVVECGIPGMLTSAEIRYYRYITRFYSGQGEVVELGTWLGKSTWYILDGLRQNPSFEGKLHCVDDFVWRSSWMDRWMEGLDRPIPSNHESFLAWFEAEVAAIAHRLVIHRARLAEFDGNESVPPFEWRGGPVEMCFVDCGRMLSVNESWYRVLRPHFTAGRTLLVLQDWQHHKAVPELWWENMKIFTDSKADEIELIHEIRDGAVATFLFVGANGSLRRSRV